MKNSRTYNLAIIVAPFACARRMHLPEVGQQAFASHPDCGTIDSAKQNRFDWILPWSAGGS